MFDGFFDGQEIKAIVGATGRRERFEFYYGGLGTPDGPECPRLRLFFHYQP